MESLNWVMVVEYMDRAQGPAVDFFTQNLPVCCDLTLTHQVEPRRPSVTHRRQARGGTTAHDKVPMRAPHGHQGIMDLGPHHREAACFMGPHGYRLTCLGASLLVPAPHSLRTANFGPVGPTCQSGGSCVCRAVLWLAIGLHTVRWTAEACLAAAGLMYCEFGCRLASYGVPRVCVRWSQE